MIYDAKKGAIPFSYGIKDLFLNSPTDRPEYMKTLWRYIPYYIWTWYYLETIFSDDGYICANNKMGVYGLKIAAVLAYNSLVENISSSVYWKISNTIGIWKHDKKLVYFCLCVDDLGITYFSYEDAQYLLKSLQKIYSVTFDMKVKHFCALELDWNYDDGHVNIKIPNYVSDTVYHFQHTPT